MFSLYNVVNLGSRIAHKCKKPVTKVVDRTHFYALALHLCIENWLGQLILNLLFFLVTFQNLCIRLVQAFAGISLTS